MNTRSLVLISVVLVLLEAGCRTMGRHKVQFDAKDFMAYNSPGTGAIHGHAFVRGEAGRSHSAAGLKVFLMPLTPYTAERVKMMRDNQVLPPPDPRLQKYVWSVVADIMGSYRFEGLAPGSYVVYSTIVWSGRRTAGDHYVVVTTPLADGEVKHVVVN